MTVFTVFIKNSGHFLLQFVVSVSIDHVYGYDSSITVLYPFYKVADCVREGTSVQPSAL